jgi:NADH-quinone oxidoreductase subunit E
VNGHFDADVIERAREIIKLYPHPRSALVPLCHLAQEQDGWLTPQAVDEIAEMVGIAPAEVIGTASFYDMLRTEPTGSYLVSICTNIACMLRGAYELLEFAEEHLGIRAGGTTADEVFTLEEAECLADCGSAPCLQVNHRFFGDLTPESFEQLTEDLRAGRLAGEVPEHGTLIRVHRKGGLAVNGSGPAVKVSTPAAKAPEPAAKASEPAAKATRPAAKRSGNPGSTGSSGNTESSGGSETKASGS